MRRVSRTDGLAHSRLDYVTVDVFARPRRPGRIAKRRLYHVSRGRRIDGTSRVRRILWWYSAANPSPVASRFLCGVGFSFILIICGEHASDWEGITVVLGACAGSEQASGCFDTDHRLQWSSSTTHSTSTRSRTPGRSHKRSGPSSAIRCGRSTARNDHWSSSHSTATRRIGCRAPPVPVRNQRDRCPSDGMVCFRGRTTALVALTRQA